MPVDISYAKALHNVDERYYEHPKALEEVSHWIDKYYELRDKYSDLASGWDYEHDQVIRLTRINRELTQYIFSLDLRRPRKFKRVA